MDKKTKEELREEYSTAIEVAKAQYDSVVKPVQEAYRAVEQCGNEACGGKR